MAQIHRPSIVSEAGPIRTVTVAVVAAVAAVLGINAVAAPGAPPAHAAGSAAGTYPVNTVTYGCVIRFYTSGPVIHRNASHPCQLVTSIGVTSTGWLQLRGVPNLPVESVQTTPDEELVRRDVEFGPSGGSGKINIRIVKGGTQTLSPNNDYLACTTCNVWVSATYKLPEPVASAPEPGTTFQGVR